MRICLIATDFPTENNKLDKTGYAYQLAKGLVESAMSLEVITLATNSPCAEIVDGISVHRVAAETNPNELGLLSTCLPNSKFLFKATVACWKKFVELHGKAPFDLVDSPEALATAILPGSTKDLPLVVRITSLSSPYLESNAHKTAFGFDDNFARLLRRSGLLMAQKVICQDETQAAFIVNGLNYPGKNVNVVDTTPGEGAFSSELAASTVPIYEASIKEFGNSSMYSKLYRKGAEQMIGDAESLYALMDKMLYDLFYQHSFRFRIQHWYKQFLKNPQNFATRLANKFR